MPLCDNNNDDPPRTRRPDDRTPLLAAYVMRGRPDTARVEQGVFRILLTEIMPLDVDAVVLIPIKHSLILLLTLVAVYTMVLQQGYNVVVSTQRIVTNREL
jgi:hypothetical protein